MDHIPDPQIIFNTTSSTNMNMSIKMEASSAVESLPHENSDIELSPAMTSPLQLLSTAASCTPKLKVTSPINNPQSIIQPSTASVVAQLPSSLSTSTPNSSSLKVIQNRAIKIIPASTKPIINKPQNLEVVKTSSSQQTLLASPTTTTTTTPSKFKIQKIQLVMNKNQDGSTTANISPSATIVSGKAGQLVLSGKSITNTYQVGTKSPYTILSSGTKVGNGPKVIVQTIDRTFAQQQQQQQKDSQSTDTQMTSNERIPENQRITESTPIDFLPVSTTNVVPATSFPKVIIQKSVTTPKQIKLKLGPGSIVNSKILKGPLPSNLKIQRNINTKGFTVLNTSQIVQIQSTPTQITTPTTLAAPIESTKLSKETTDWEQELDDANRTKEHKERLAESNGGGSAAKKPRLDDSAESIQEIVQNSNENIIIESSEIDSSSNIIYGKLLTCDFEFLNFCIKNSNFEKPLNF